ncbi:MAG: polysaccharide lyase beta-sandwich domain-containing protein, partial [Candidatus Cryptobacteroides sp.]
LKKISIQLRSGKEIKIHNLKISTGEPNFIIALGHGVESGQGNDNVFRYIQVTNVSADEMPQKMNALLQDLEMEMNGKAVHSVFSAKSRTWQYAFFEPGSSSVGGISVKAEAPAQIMLREDGNCWVLSAQNPIPDVSRQSLSFETSLRLTPGVYSYMTKGVYRMEGESVTVSGCGESCRVTFELPDIRDEEKYNHQTELYSAMPITVRIPKEESR